ncbi:hypothetical protein FDP41_008699 [Naegleria fowleri]|uniref:Homeobox domain-containing protein n=1 Tax=Naegleria fowleri TaxID=5763 RepID=A0A6A5BGA8_NAEFO|nr:uncharacterized protein FDP41_008699 [Naegleria fowleri]KAF0973035.1 hypothetical protein FDP41_008699 [Naegleria fowleri]
MQHPIMNLFPSPSNAESQEKSLPTTDSIFHSDTPSFGNASTLTAPESNLSCDHSFLSLFNERETFAFEDANLTTHYQTTPQSNLLQTLSGCHNHHLWPTPLPSSLFALDFHTSYSFDSVFNSNSELGEDDNSPLWNTSSRLLIDFPSREMMFPSPLSLNTIPLKPYRDQKILMSAASTSSLNPSKLEMTQPTLESISKNIETLLEESWKVNDVTFMKELKRIENDVRCALIVKEHMKNSSRRGSSCSSSSSSNNCNPTSASNSTQNTSYSSKELTIKEMKKEEETNNTNERQILTRSQLAKITQKKPSTTASSSSSRKNSSSIVRESSSSKRKREPSVLHSKRKLSQTKETHDDSKTEESSSDHDDGSGNESDSDFDPTIASGQGSSTDDEEETEEEEDESKSSSSTTTCKRKVKSERNRTSVVVASSADCSSSSSASPATKKRKRTTFAKADIALLTKWLHSHSSNPYPTDEEKQTLLKSVNMTKEQLETWFVNNRKRLLPQHKYVRKTPVRVESETFNQRLLKQMEKETGSKETKKNKV